ncbi:AraC-like DNA-binding protein [Geodermatophilus bullaregiensis]|uniref:helix-turn-helix domain-containing protein n=1 Tax=Geodermatophilus bullaregiensis TaxID=1564160 RepID=UPI001959F20B|nr:helix-turn-helix domain-containing protein [Geodermatophilus bullaregiensis]MBM7808525.1 AraC-like DNA-binding protein [Geodermatophilus bullaregiensis]
MRVSRTCPACGYTADYASAPLADARHRRHSCAKHRRGLDQAARRVERLQPRLTRECSHPQACHRHGTRAAYVKDRCRCTECTAANTAASRTATRERAYGRWQPYVDASPVREHIAALRAVGIGVERIAHLAGISVSHIRELAERDHGDSPGTQRVRPGTAARILGIGISDASRAPHSRVDATGTRRRLQALQAVGWSVELLAVQLGRRPNSLHRSMTGRSVTAGTAQEVTTLYEQLWHIRPPRMTGEQRAAADAAQAHAAAQGWLPPLAWDDIDSDPTPPATIAGASQQGDMDEIAVERALAGDHITYDDLTTVEQQEVIRRLTARGSSIRDIAAQLGTTKRTVSRRRASFGAA